MNHAKADFDVISNESLHVSEITKSQLKQILLGRSLELDKKKISIITLSPDAPEADKLDLEAMGMSAIQAKKHWLTQVFNGNLSNTPPAADTVDELIQKVVSTTGSIAVIPKGKDPGKAKRLKLK